MKTEYGVCYLILGRYPHFIPVISYILSRSAEKKLRQRT